MKKILSLALALCTLNCRAANTTLITPNTITISTGNTTQATPITPATILSLSPQLPEEVQNNSHIIINPMHHASAANGVFIQQIPKKAAKYAPAPENKLIAIKIAGANDRFFSAAHSYDDLDRTAIWKDHTHQKQLQERIHRDKILTYQNASRLAYALITEQAASSKELDLICVPKNIPLFN